MKKHSLLWRRVGMLVFVILLALSIAACSKKKVETPNTTEQAMVPTTTDPLLLNDPLSGVDQPIADETVVDRPVRDEELISEPVRSPSPSPSGQSVERSLESDIQNGTEAGAAQIAKDTALRQEDIEDAAAVITSDGNILVAVSLKNKNTGLSDASTTAILKATQTRGVTRITTVPEHFTIVQSIERDAEGAPVLPTHIRDIWDNL